MISIPECIQIEIMKFFLKTSVPRVLNESSNLLKNRGEDNND